MIMDALVSIIGGLGLFFIGIRGLSTHMSQLTGRRMRFWVARSTDNYFLGAFVGALSGALTQSTNAITVILMGLASADLITPRKARPILAWSNVGTAVLVVVAAVDIHLFVLAIIGATGICFYLNLDQSGRWRPLVSALLALGLLFLGLEIIRGGSQELRSIAAVQDVFRAAARWSLSAILAGVALALVAQSSATVSVIAIALASSGLLTLEQAMLTVYGASIGSGLGTFAVAANVRGTPRQLAIFQMVVKLSGVFVLIPLYYVESYAGVPLVAFAVRAVASSPSTQVVLVYLLCQLASVLAQALIGDSIEPILVRLCPPSAQESLSKPRYLYPQSLSEPETALALVDREHARIFAFLPAYIGIDDHLEDAAQHLDRASIPAIALALVTAVADFLGGFADTGASRSILERVADRQARNSLLLSLHETFAELGDVLAQPFVTPALQSLADNLTEGLGALLLTAEEAVRSLDPEDLVLLRQLTGDRDSMVDEMRRRVMAADQFLASDDQRHLYALTGLFERVVWMLRRYANLLATELTLEPRLVQAVGT